LTASLWKKEEKRRGQKYQGLVYEWSKEEEKKKRRKEKNRKYWLETGGEGVNHR
jgi:hypothetical protein